MCFKISIFLFHSYHLLKKCYDSYIYHSTYTIVKILKKTMAVPLTNESILLLCVITFNTYIISLGATYVKNYMEMELVMYY